MTKNEYLEQKKRIDDKTNETITEIENIESELLKTPTPAD